MRRRNVAVLFRLTPKEAQCLDAKVRRSGLSREAYLRQLIKGGGTKRCAATGLLFHDEGALPDREQPGRDCRECPYDAYGGCAQI